MNPKVNIKHYREMRGISQKDLCEKLGISQGYLSSIERSVKSPTLRMLYRIAEELNVCPRLLLSCKIICNEKHMCNLEGE